jgi:hypothetical protein
MKSAILIVSACCVFFLTSCSDQSLTSDEEYRTRKGPAAFSPDFTNVLPDPSTGRPAGGY